LFGLSSGLTCSGALSFVMWHWLNQTTVIGLLLLAGAGVAWRSAWFAYASRRWPTTPVRLHYLGMSGPRKAGTYLSTVRYSYTVDGVTYESTRWRFGSITGKNTRALAHAMSTQIKPIDPVVFYDPHKPGRSCLVTGPEEVTLSAAIIGSVIGIGLLVIGIR
jgi:Protein of unknown function (DUF3592)